MKHTQWILLMPREVETQKTCWLVGSFNVVNFVFEVIQKYTQTLETTNKKKSTIKFNHVRVILLVRSITSKRQ
jgi:hypothetical protein